MISDDLEITNVEKRLLEDQAEVQARLQADMARVPGFVAFMIRTTNWLEYERAKLLMQGNEKQAQGIENAMQKLRSFLPTDRGR